ncbi:MAG: endonuclease/exonuclease/phosphatase family protein [Bdellovibrionales bacterium]|nr:endonuclease/exonuclease/phosphatase family protein [Bdellovibrionales bacterium]
MAKLRNIVLILILAQFWICALSAEEIPVPEDTLKEFGEASKKVLDSNEIKLLVWNLKKGKKPQFREGYLDQCASKDLLILQEAYLSDSSVDVYQSLNGVFSSMAISFFDNSGIGTGVMTGSSARPTSIVYQRSEDTEGDGRLTPKIVLLSKFAFKNKSKELLVVNIHGLNIVRNGAQRRQLDEAMKEVNQHDGPVIFAGDFNSWGPFRPRNLIKYMAGHGLKEVTYPSNEGRTEGIGVGGFLDHIFVRDLQVVRSRVRSDWPKNQASDHTALEAVLSYR